MTDPLAALLADGRPHDFEEEVLTDATDLWDAMYLPVRCSQCGNDMNVEPHRADCRAAAYIAAMHWPATPVFERGCE